MTRRTKGTESRDGIMRLSVQVRVRLSGREMAVLVARGASDRQSLTGLTADEILAIVRVQLAERGTEALLFGEDEADPMLLDWAADLVRWRFPELYP